MSDVDNLKKLFQESIAAANLDVEGDIDPALTLSLGQQYLNIMLIGLIPFSITQIYAGSLRETGESVKPMVAGVCSVIADVVFNYLLIYGKFGFPELGVRGAAVATVIARFVEMSVIVVWAHREKIKHTFLMGVYRTFLVPMAMAKPIVIKGLPIFLNEFLWAGGMAMLTVCYSMRGLDALQPLVDDPSVTEIMINGPEDIFIEQNGRLFKKNVKFDSEEKL